ncbi:hypothetical protein [Paraburkholderia phytofirmans]|uniref:hypothetical protein n=1 Tax=Paraburkholderia TaxID=1822464 RepID=UPI0013145949|nr:hypothetical protein [Paraburkholderia phytofirmans]
MIKVFFAFGGGIGGGFVAVPGLGFFACAALVCLVVCLSMVSGFHWPGFCAFP